MNKKHFIILIILNLNYLSSRGNVFAKFARDSTLADRYYTPLTKGKSSHTNGIPFIAGEFMIPEKEGATVSCETNGVKAESVYLFGCINSVHLPNPFWGGSDGFQNFFIGDSIGTLTISYVSGKTSHIPLILGFSVWWNDTYRIAPEPFVFNKKAFAKLNRSLYVANGISLKKTPYYIKIDLNNEPVKKVSIQDNPNKIGYMIVNGITFSNVKNGLSLNAVSWKKLQGNPIPPEQYKWQKKHTIKSSHPYSAAQQKAVSEVEHLLSNSPDDISSKTISKVKPVITADNFQGPKVKFGGATLGKLLTNIYYENADQILERIDSTGKVHESAKGSDFYRGFGTWSPGLGAFYDDSYTRIRALTILSAMGFTSKANNAINYFDDWLMYFPRAFPKIQLGGKPVPGHAVVIANKPHFYFDKLDRKRWPTQFKTHDFGNPENDGHGLLMLNAWRTWIKDGRRPEKVNSRWTAITEAVEYIRWALDHPDLSFSQHGLLYSESEGGMDKESMYCDFPCYIGLLAYADMAKTAGKPEKAKDWQNLAARLLKAMNAYYPKNEKLWGKVWDADKSAEWRWAGDHSTLAPIVIGMDYWGFDVLHHLPAGWKSITLNTYKRQLTKTQFPGISAAGIGYGQCYLTQASLLVDEMKEASKDIARLAQFCFSPRLPHPYRVPEGATVKADGSQWRRWGDLGNLYQLAEVVYTVQVMIGIDDIQTDTVKLMPRLANNINSMEVSEWPIRTYSGAESILTPLSLKINRNVQHTTFNAKVRTVKSVNNFRFRLGPFPLNVNEVEISLNGKTEKKHLKQSGDSKWVWISFGDGQKNSYTIRSKVLW